MNFGFRQGNLGLRVGPFGLILIGILYLMALPAILLIKLVVYIAAGRKESQAKKEVQEQLLAKLTAYRDETLAKAAPGWQRDQLQYWFDIAIPTFTEIKLKGATPHLIQEYQQAMRSIDALLSMRIVKCGKCGAVDQVAGKPCGYCGEIVVLSGIKK